MSNITAPQFTADDYLEEDSVDAKPKHGTTSQAGWGAAASFLKRKSNPSESKFAAFLKFSEKQVLVRFLQDEPFSVYEEHWIDRTEGRRSFYCLGSECPLCTIAGDKPKVKVAFNVLVLSEEQPQVQILIAVPTLARLLMDVHEDPKKGPLTRYSWAIRRIGMGRDTQYTIERVRATDLAEEWELDPDEVDSAVAVAVPYDASAIFVSPREELLELARSLVA